MANSLFRSLRRASSVLKISYSASISLRSVVRNQTPICSPFRQFIPLEQQIPAWVYRNFSHGSVNLVISGGKTKFETHEVDPPKKDKWKTKKRLKQQRKREKQKRKAANKRDPRRLGVKGKKKQKFANAEERIKYKIEKAKVKEALLIERLKRYEIPRVQGPVAKPDGLTGEERFYLKKMAQKSTNYLQVGRRGLFGGVVLNMHMHWKRHETVKVICKPCKPGQVHEYAQEIARLSGGIPIHIIGDDTIIFYRGKNYVQPEVMSPVDTLSKKKALEKSKYEQSLESVRRFIAIAEKELELYYRHVALYGDPNDRDPLSILERPSGNSWIKRNHGLNGKRNFVLSSDNFSTDMSDMEADSTDIGFQISETEANSEGGHLSISESDSEEDSLLDFRGEERGAYYAKMEDDGLGASPGSLSMSKRSFHYNNPCLLSEGIPTIRD
ncbi:CRM-domain containing factor CFM3B, chloroplastic [Neltuma alba]|uniref:CRM-domain containing factor CFM3B, chloroplastic n=1 Tax=Neltuma alba TaxID=207710 RepID=UPI0010A3A419|nr:CRM-domain containing factor CFM3B, chloroplastic [Prosopis alba]